MKKILFAALIGGLVRQAGHKLRVTGNAQSATAQIIRADDPDFTYEVTWELRKNQNGNPNAEDAKLLGKDVWQKYPASMLKSRAIAQVARDACEEVLFGLHYTPEELDVNVGADGEPVNAQVTQLRRVEPGEPDQWATPAPNQGTDFEPHAAAQALAARAADAKDRFIMGALIDEAKRYVPADARIFAPDTSQPDALREYLLRRWSALPKAPEQKEERSDGVTDAEFTDPVADAEQKLRATAAHAGLDTLDADFEQSYGIPIAEAGIQQLTEMTRLLGGAA